MGLGRGTKGQKRLSAICVSFPHKYMLIKIYDKCFYYELIHNSTLICYDHCHGVLRTWGVGVGGVLAAVF